MSDPAYSMAGGRTGRLDEPKTVLMQAWWERVRSFVNETRDEGWPVMATVVQTKDGRTLGLLSVEFGTGMTPEQAVLASPLPIEVES